MVLDDINLILQALNKTQQISSIERFAYMQNLFSNYGYRNILLLARQSNINNIDLEDIKTIEEWLNIGVEPSAFTNPIYVYVKEKNGDKSYLRKAIAYDIKQTDAIYKDYESRVVKLSEEGDSKENLLDGLKTYIMSNMSIEINTDDTNTSDDYFPYTPTIFVNKQIPIENQIQSLLFNLQKEALYGEQIRKFTYIDDDSDYTNAINKSIANSYLERLNLPKIEFSMNEKMALFVDVEKTLSDLSDKIRISKEKLAFDSFINKSKSTEKKQYKKTYPKSKIPPKKKSSKQFVDLKEFYLDKEEAEGLKKKTNEEIALSNPRELLRQLNYETISETQYEIKFKRRTERTSSATFKIDNKVWVWHDFGDGAGGNAISLVKDAFSNFDQSEVYNYVCDALGVKNYYKMRKEELAFDELQALKDANWSEKDIAEFYYKRDLYARGCQKDEVEERLAEYRKNIQNNTGEVESPIISKPEKTTKEAIKEHQIKTEEMKKANAEFEKEHKVNSRVVYASKVIPVKYHKWLKEERGITNLDIENFYHIKGETWKLDENSKPVDIKVKEGVGVLCAEKDKLQEAFNEIETKGFKYFNEPRNSELFTFGADFHFPPYTFTLDDKDKTEVTMKTQSVGNKKNSSFMNRKGKRIAPIESKMDYAAASQEIDFRKNGINPDIANSTSNADIVAKNIATGNYEESPIFFNQNDVAGIRFIVDIHKIAFEEYNHKIDNFDFFNYMQEEYKWDINDLVKEKIQLKSRLQSGNLTDLTYFIEQFKKSPDADEKEKEIKKLEEYLSNTVAHLNLDTQKSSFKASAFKIN